MKVTFTHKRKKSELTVFGPSEAKCYAVPASYSEDGYYLATWGPGEYEPVPSCAVDAVTLLAHLAVEKAEPEGLVVRELFCAEGVTYAAS